MTSELDYNNFEKLADHYNCEIPADVQSFLSSFNRSFNNGSIDFLKNEKFQLKFKTEDGFETSDMIEVVFSTQEIIEQLPFIGYLEELKTHFELSYNYVQTQFLFPIIGLMDGTLYIAISGDNRGSLYIADNGDFGITKVEFDLRDLAQKLKSN